MTPMHHISLDDARVSLARMHAEPKTPPRPVFVAAGYLDPGFISGDIVKRLRLVTDEHAPIFSVSFFTCANFDSCRDRLIEAIEREFPSDDPDSTIEVDIVGFSMGGLVARHAAMPRESGKRVNVVRLFTIGTPHRGANLASLAFFDRRAIDMRSGSDFLAQLDADLETARYELIPYVRTHDAVVGEANAAPHGREPILVANKAFSLSHTMAGADERIIADIARRLRGE